MKHVIIGAGPAGVIAAETLRTLDAACEIRIFGEESEKPYSRMALPYLLARNVGEDGTHLRHAEQHFSERAIDVQQQRVVSVDASARTLALENGNTENYDRLLVASGSHTVRPPISGMDLAAVENCWTLEDARRIAAKAVPGSRVVLMGAGFIGCIVLEALAARKVNLTVIEMADRMLPRMMDDTGGEIIKTWCQNRDVAVLTDTAVESVSEATSSGAVSLKLADGSSLDADLVVCATGVRPNVQFLDGTADLSTGRHEVHAIQPTASEHGRIAARSMVGLESHYRGSLSMNVLNTLGLVSSSFGIWDGVDGGERSTAVDVEGSRYLRLEFEEDRLVGALALGLTQHVGVIRGLMQTEIPLGHWKSRLLKDPHQIMQAYLECTQGLTPSAL